MASNPVSPKPRGRTPDIENKDGWELLFSLFGSATQELEQVGGADAWFQYLRHGDEQPEMP